MSAIQRTLKIRPDETRLVLSMSALSFVGMAGLAIGQSGANALFFDRIGTDVNDLLEETNVEELASDLDKKLPA